MFRLTLEFKTDKYITYKGEILKKLSIEGSKKLILEVLYDFKNEIMERHNTTQYRLSRQISSIEDDIRKLELDDIGLNGITKSYTNKYINTNLTISRYIVINVTVFATNETFRLKGVLNEVLDELNDLPDRIYTPISKHKEELRKDISLTIIDIRNGVLNKKYSKLSYILE